MDWLPFFTYWFNILLINIESRKALNQCDTGATMSALVRINTCRLLPLESEELTLSWGGSRKKKKSSKLVQHWKKPTSCQVQLKYHTKTEPERADLMSVLKRTRWWGEGVFSHGVSDSHIFWEDGKRWAELQMLRLVLLTLRSYLCSSPLGLSTNWRWLCKISSTARPLSVPLFTDLGRLATLAYLKWGVK